MARVCVSHAARLRAEDHLRPTELVTDAPAANQRFPAAGARLAIVNASIRAAGRIKEGLCLSSDGGVRVVLGLV
jgi:hypothetical protein